MGIIAGLFVAGIAAAMALAAAAEQRRARFRSWRTAAQRVGLTDLQEEAGGLLRGGWLRGRSGPLDIRLERRQDGGKERYRTLISIGGLGHGTGGLSLRREDFAATVRRFLGSEIEIGSPAFDAAHFVQGPAALALALLDAETRRKLADLLAGSLQGRRVRAALRDGVLEVWPRERGRGLPAKQLAKLLEGVIDVARRLVAPSDLASCIAQNLREEPEPGVRLQSVIVLARELPQHPATRQVLLAAREDASAEVRLRAAAALGGEGRETLLALLASDETDDACAARAVLALARGGDGLAAEKAEAELRRALARRHEETVLACVEALARRSRAESERLLLQALRMGKARVGVAAAGVLGRMGTAGAIAPLRKAAAPLWSGEVGQAARQAIAEIQARLTGAAPGQLSLTGSDAGALSLTGHEPGRLSLAGGGPAGPDAAENDAAEDETAEDAWSQPSAVAERS